MHKFFYILICVTVLSSSALAVDSIVPTGPEGFNAVEVSFDHGDEVPELLPVEEDAHPAQEHVCQEGIIFHAPGLEHFHRPAESLVGLVQGVELEEVMMGSLPGRRHRPTVAQVLAVGPGVHALHGPARRPSARGSAPPP